MQTTYCWLSTLLILVNIVFVLDAQPSSTCFINNDPYIIYLECYETNSHCKGCLPAQPEFEENWFEEFLIRRYLCHYNGWNYSIEVVKDVAWNAPVTLEQTIGMFEGFEDLNQVLFENLLKEFLYLSTKINIPIFYRYEAINDNNPHVRYAIDAKGFGFDLNTCDSLDNWENLAFELKEYVQQRMIVTNKGVLYVISASMDNSTRIKELEDPWSFQPSLEEQQVWEKILQSLEIEE